MAKKPDITTIASGYYSTTMLNANFSELRNAFDNTLSLDGSTPNALQADLDLNNNSILNADVYANSLTLNGQLVGELTTAFNWKGAWVTGTSYLQYDVVSNAGSSYIALEDHTAGATFSVDLSGGKWQLLASKGDSGAGTGDLLSTNNLSDLADAPTALGNLGLTSTSAQINLLSTITGLTGSDASLVSGTAGTTDYFAKWNADGDLVEGPSFVDEDDMASDSATAVPSQQSVKAYVDGEVGGVVVPFAEAYVTYSGTTPSMVAEYGMASVSRPAVGDTSFVFDSAQPDTNYVIESHLQSGIGNSDHRYSYWVYAKSTTGFTVRWRFTTLAAADVDISVKCTRIA